MTIKLQQCQWVANSFFGHRLHYMNSFNSFGLDSSILYISYKVHAFWFIDLIKKRRLKICREACRQFQIHAFCCIDLILKKKWKCRQFQIFLVFQDFVLDSAIPRILGGLLALTFFPCHSGFSGFFWQFLTAPSCWLSSISKLDQCPLLLMYNSI